MLANFLRGVSGHREFGSLHFINEGLQMSHDKFAVESIRVQLNGAEPPNINIRFWKRQGAVNGVRRTNSKVVSRMAQYVRIIFGIISGIIDFRLNF